MIELKFYKNKGYKQLELLAAKYGIKHKKGCGIDYLAKIVRNYEQLQHIPPELPASAPAAEPMPATEPASTGALNQTAVPAAETITASTPADPVQFEKLCSADTLQNPEQLAADTAAAEKAFNSSKMMYMFGAKFIFSLWANKADIPEIELKDNEAEGIAEPCVELEQIYFPNGFSRESRAWTALLTAVGCVAGSRFVMVNKKRKELNAVPSVPPAVESFAANTQSEPLNNAAG